MPTDPPITDADRAAAEFHAAIYETLKIYLPSNMHEGGLDQIEYITEDIVEKLQPVIASHREKREKRLVEALRFYARQDNHQHHKLTGQEIDIDGGETARQALKEEGYDLSEKGANE